MAYSSTVANQQAQLNAQNFGKQGFTPLSVDGLMGPLTQTALAQFGTPSNLTMVNGSPVIPTNILQQNGTMPQMAPVNQTLTPQQFVAGLTPLQGTQMQSVNAAAPGAAVNATGQVNKLEGGRTALVKRLGAAQQQLLGQGQEQLRLEQQMQIPQSVKDIAMLTDQINAKQAAYNNTEEAYRNGAISSNAIATGRVQRLQQAAAVELGGLSALLMGKQGNMEAARAQVDRTLALEFDPIKQEIENTKTFLELNYQDLSRADKQQAQAVQAQLDKDKADLDYFRDVKKMYIDNALKSGNASAMNSATSARSLKELQALNAAGFGTGTPSEKVESLNNTLSLIDTLKTSKGLNSRVGPTSLGRRFAAFGDAFGAGEAFAGSVQQLTSKQTLDMLINLKQQGGTLGALSDQERVTLQNAASRIAAWERKDSNGLGKGTWDISEKQFRSELDNLTSITNNALIRAGGSPLDTTLKSDDYQQIQSMLNTGQFNPASFY